MNASVELLTSIGDGDIPSIRRIVAKAPGVLNVADNHGFTPLMKAVSSVDRDAAVIQELLEAGAEVNRQTEEGYTALHCAIDVDGEANENANEVIKLLVDSGADISLKQHWGWTPLLQAVIEGSPTEVHSLLTLGANPNDTLPVETLPAFNSGCTALMAALTNHRSELIVELLLEAGADPRNRSATGQTFVQYLDDTLSGSSRDEFSTSLRRCREIAQEYKDNNLN